MHLYNNNKRFAIFPDMNNAYKFKCELGVLSMLSSPCYTYPPKVLCATFHECSVTNLTVYVPHFINETSQTIYNKIIMPIGQNCYLQFDTRIHQ